MIPYSNGVQKENRKVPKIYRKPNVYSTWLGTGAMPIEFDVVVMSNILRLFIERGLILNDYDLATINYIEKVIINGRYLKAPFQTAPWYPSSIVIFYHLVNFFSDCLPIKFQEYTETFTQHFQLLSKMANSIMDKVLLALSSMDLKLDTFHINYPQDWEKDLIRYPFYIGGMLTATRSKLGWYLAQNPLFHWRFICPAFNYTILLYYELRKREQTQPYKKSLE